MALDVAEKNGESLSDSEAADGWRMCTMEWWMITVDRTWKLLLVKIQDDEYQWDWYCSGFTRVFSTLLVFDDDDDDDDDDYDYPQWALQPPAVT